MIFIKKMESSWKLSMMLHLALLISLLANGGSSSPLPDDYSDINSGDEYYVDVLQLPKYDVVSLKTDFDNDPVVSSISSGVKSSLQGKPDNVTATVEDFQLLTATNTTADDSVLDALSELLFLSKLLEGNLQYYESRKQQDPVWPFSLASKMGSKGAGQQEDPTFREDLHQAVSGIVIMKMMEERVTLINKYVQDFLSTTPSAVTIATLFGGDKSAQVMEGLFALKYLEGYLHATNIMIDELMTDDGSSNNGGAADAAASGMFPWVTPKPGLVTNDEDDIEAGIEAFIILMLTAIGFFFVLYLIVYLLWKLVQKCYEARTSVCAGGCTSSPKVRSKYEQI